MILQYRGVTFNTGGNMIDVIQVEIEQILAQYVSFFSAPFQFKEL